MVNFQKILLVDDHPLIVEAYRSALLQLQQQSGSYEFSIDEACDLDTAYGSIKRNAMLLNSSDEQSSVPYQLLIIDLKLPVSHDKKLLCGEDLALKAREYLPKAKIIIATSYDDNFRLNNILKKINPEGLILKSDIDIRDLTFAISSVLNNIPYYSRTVLKLIQKRLSQSFHIDDLDVRILYELSLGTKTKDLPTSIPLSCTGIEKRKRHLKEIFDVLHADDRELLEVAREKGFI